MDDQIVRRAAVLQAKLKFLEGQKDSFTDREDILAFQRFKKQFDNVVLRHQDELTSNPLATVRQHFENDKTLINKLRQIDAEARLRKIALTTQSRWLTPEFLENTIQWLPSQKEAFEEELSMVHARLSHGHWDKTSGRLLPGVTAIVEILSEDDLLAPDTEEWVAAASIRGPRCEAYLRTLAAVEETVTQKVLYVMHGTERIGPLLLDDLEKLLAERMVFAFDLAWHQAVDEWQPLFQLAMSLRKLEILQRLGKSAPFTEAMLQRKLFYAARDGEIRGPFLLDDLNLLLAKRMVSTTELAWHNSIADWQPLSELIRILEEQQSFRLRGSLRFMQWITSGRWMARRSRPDLSKLKDLTSTAHTLSPIAKSPQPFDERTDAFTLNLPTLTTRRDLEEFFNNQHAPPFVIDDRDGDRVNITGYCTDLARLRYVGKLFTDKSAQEVEPSATEKDATETTRGVNAQKHKSELGWLGLALTVAVIIVGTAWYAESTNRAATEATPYSPLRWLRVTQPVQVTLRDYGRVSICCGEIVQLVSEEGSNVRIRYAGEECVIPRSATISKETEP
jgi:hypothetical protein